MNSYQKLKAENARLRNERNIVVFEPESKEAEFIRLRLLHIRATEDQLMFGNSLTKAEGLSNLTRVTTDEINALRCPAYQRII